MPFRAPAAVALIAILTASASLRAEPAPHGDPGTGSPVSGPPALAPQRPLPGQPLLGPYHRVPERRQRRVSRMDYVALPPASRHHHDGFYLRLAGGVGRLGDSMAADSAYFAGPSSAGSVHFASSPSGLAVATEVAAGYSVLPGLALGGGVYTATLPSTTAAGLNGESYHFYISQLALFSPFVDYYVNARAGLHIQAGAGLAAYVAGQGDPASYGPRALAHTALGFGFMAGTGYEWWVSDEWGVGLLGRFTYAWTNGSDGDGVHWQHHTNAFVLLVSATYN